MSDICLADVEPLRAEEALIGFLQEALPHRAKAWDLEARADEVTRDAYDPESLIGRLEAQWSLDLDDVPTHARLGVMAVQVFDAGLTLVHRLPVEEHPDALWPAAAVRAAHQIRAERPWNMFAGPLPLDAHITETPLGPQGIFGGLVGLVNLIRSVHPDIDNDPKPIVVQDLSKLTMELGGRLARTALDHMVDHVEPDAYGFWLPSPTDLAKSSA